MIVTVTPSLRPSMWPNVVENISRQHRKPDWSILVRHKLGARTDAIDWVRGCEAAGVYPLVIDAREEDCLGDVLGIGFKAASGLMDCGGLICTFDDDDWYGEYYLTEAEEFLDGHPDAAIIGKQTYRCRWMDGSRPPRLMLPRWTPNPERAGSVAGPTISVNVDLWHQYPNFRHPEGDPIADVGIIMAAHGCGLPIYTTTPDHFWLQRYGPEHGHGWVWDGE